LLLVVATSRAAVISVNFSIGGGDDGSVDTNETAVVGSDAADTAISNAVNVSGAYWNNINVSSAIGAPDILPGATQGGNSIALQDDAGNSVATLTSSGSFWCNSSDATDNAGNRSAVGEAGLLQSALYIAASESVSVGGLAAWAPNGYRVIVFCEAGTLNRTMWIRATDGTADQTVHYSDDTNVSFDGDADEDGLADWMQATGTNSGSATLHGNYVVFAPVYGGDTISISANGRGAIVGLQIVQAPLQGTLFIVR